MERRPAQYCLTLVSDGQNAGRYLDPTLLCRARGAGRAGGGLSHVCRSPTGAVRHPVLSAPPSRTHVVVSHRPGALRDLAGARGRVGRDGTAGLCRASLSPLSRMRHPQLWFCPGLLRGVRARLLGCFLVQRPGRMPIVQHPAHGGDGGASDRSRVAAVAAAAVGASPYPSGCAISCTTMRRCKAWSCASCCARSSAVCANTVPAAAPRPAWARWSSSTASARP